MVLNWGKKMAVKKDDSEEMSMEEILASIRKYVTNEPQTSHDPATASESHDPESLIVHPNPGNNSHRTPPHSPKEKEIDETHPHKHHSEAVLELTNPLENEEEEESYQHRYHQEAFSQISPQIPTDERNKISEPPPPHSTATAIDEERKSPVMKHSEPTSSQQNFSGDELTSGEALKASATSLSRLREATKPTPAPSPKQENIGSSPTLDQLIRDLTKPLVKEWLDKNLSTMVESMVSKEIKRITKEME